MLPFILEAAAVFFVGMLPFILTAFPNRYAAANQRLSNPEFLLSTWTRAVAVVALILYIATRQPAGVASIALHPGSLDRNISDAFIGLFIFATYIVLISIAARLFRKKTAQPAPLPDNDGEPKLNDVTRYKKLPERVSYLLVLIFMVLAEDLVSRGYLVFLLGTRLHDLIPGIIISITFSILAHLYQGKRVGVIVYHALFAAIFIVLLLITGNLLAVIAGHVYYDFLWTIGRWRVQDRQIPKTAPTPYATIEKYFYPAFIIVNVCILGFFALLAGFRPVFF